ncbi:hypothetical protein TNCV_2611431 [Trichonephila clavipes]|nr:hypothetical protein TNCV_2611431 [Trichonephila clavipes]
MNGHVGPVCPLSINVSEENGGQSRRPSTTTNEKNNAGVHDKVMGVNLCYMEKKDLLKNKYVDTLNLKRLLLHQI